MNSIRIVPLFSGSTGNCIFIEGGGARILVDAGVSAKRICCALEYIGCNIDSVDAVFITHEHIDHVKGLPVLLRRHCPTVYMTRGSYDAAGLGINAVFIEPCERVKIKDLEVQAFPLSHDTVCCVGYTAQCGGHKVGVMTDTGYVTDEAVASMIGCETALIESNHDIHMLRHGRYPRSLQKRILSERGHLSNPDCARFCAFLAGRGTKKFILAHLSRENNDPATALACAKDMIASEVECVCAPEAVI